jgi:probable rRNA maturation factor
MPKNIINISKKTGCRIPLKITWFRKVEETVLKNLFLKNNLEIDIYLTDDNDIKKLNKAHRKLDKPTDVLSFYMEEDKPGNFVSPPDGIVHLGEIVISFETALRDCRKQNISIEDEMCFLLIHGTLHLLGYDHEDLADGAKMRKKEDELFGKL